MEVDTVGTDLTQQAHEFGGAFRLAHRSAERVAANGANGPETKGEFLLGFGRIICHGDLTYCKRNGMAGTEVISEEILICAL